MALQEMFKTCVGQIHCLCQSVSTLYLVSNLKGYPLCLFLCVFFFFCYPTDSGYTQGESSKKGDWHPDDQ